MNFKKIIVGTFVAASMLFVGTNTTTVHATNTNVETPTGTIIDQFLAMLNGTEEAATAAINKFGSPTVIANKMIPFGKNPKILKTDGNCVRVALQQDEDTNVYVFCEENGKIVSFEWYDEEGED